MSRQQNTYAKRSREMEKKRKAEQKRERRIQRRQETDATSVETSLAETADVVGLAGSAS